MQKLPPLQYTREPHLFTRKHAKHLYGCPRCEKKKQARKAIRETSGKAGPSLREAPALVTHQEVEAYSIPRPTSALANL